MDNAFIVPRIANVIHTTEAKIEDSIAGIHATTQSVVEARRALDLSAPSVQKALSLIHSAATKAAEAQAAYAAAHVELDILREKLGLRPDGTGVWKVEGKSEEIQLAQAS